MKKDKSTDTKQSFFTRLTRLISSKPSTRDEVAELLRDAHDNNILDHEALEIMEGALSVADQQVREIMVPRSQMIVIPEEADIAQVLALVTESKHSRFPVTGESIEDIKGILLAKDLLPLALTGNENFNLAQVIRPATIVPESKRLNVLLKEFREQRYHMAIIMDEYASVAGLVTIEDILEEIVGDIEDETDREYQQHIKRQEDGNYQLAALTPIEDFNEYFGSGLSEDEFDTIGGLVTRAFGHLPKVGESTQLENYRIEVLEGDERQIHLLEMRVLSPDPA